MNTLKESCPAELQFYIETEIIPCYNDFDKAHQVNHSQKVISESLILAKSYPVNTNMVYVIAAYHDLGLSKGREFHHIESGKMLIEDEKLRVWFTNEQLTLMQEAIEDHRASSKHEPRSIYGKIVAEADRIINPEITLRRTVQFGLSHHPEKGKEEQYGDFCAHLKEKYAEGGYLKLWIPESSNALKLKELRIIIESESVLRGIFERIYNEETNPVVIR
ncbi:MAG: HD domain-containing protein [Bacteroidales bacterium]